MFRLCRFYIRQTVIPSTEDFVAIKIWHVINCLNKRRTIRSQETDGNTDKDHSVQEGHGEKVSVWKAVISDAQIDSSMSVATIKQY